MSENKNNKEITKAKAKPERKKLGKKGILIIVLSALALVGITLGIVFAVINSNESISQYSKKKLSKYVTVSEELYKSFNVVVNMDEITDLDVEEQIIKILRSHKKELPDNGSVHSSPYVNISAGDVAYIYYRGYTIENGVKVYFDGGCNFGDEENYKLEIGSGQFVAGFETGLINRLPGNDVEGAVKQKYYEVYSNINHKNAGFVEAGDIVSITYSVMRTDNTMLQKQTAIIDLSDPDIDTKWGVGFTDFLVGQIINRNNVIKKYEDNDALFLPTVCEGKSGDDMYHDITINSATSVGKNGLDPLIVEVQFPKDYKATDLAGKQGYFEVYVTGVQDYDTPVLDDAFITDKIKFTESDLASYSGNTLVEKYKSYIKEALKAMREQKITTLKEEAFWENLLDNAQFKKLPQKEVDKYYNVMVSDIVRAYNEEVANSGTSGSATLDSYAVYVLGLESGADWKASVRADAESSVKQKLIFYYIVREEGIEIPEDEYNKRYEPIFNDHLQDYLDYYNITEGMANYEKKLAEGKAEVLKTYGEEYFKELVLYDYVIEIMMKRAVLVNG